MSDDVKPALTASEWAQAGGFRMPFVYDVIFGRGKTDGEYRHAHAAVALYGQPFGFDDEDRALLYLLAEVLPNRGNIAEEHVARIKTMADKVAALLPPEPTDG